MFTPLSARRRRGPECDYVDQLELDDLSLSDYRNGLMIDPNLTIYFADVNGGLAEKLETRVPGRLVWVRDFAGPNSTKMVRVSTAVSAP